MFETLIEHYDSIILFDKSSGEVVFQNQEFINLSNDKIRNTEDLSTFFYNNGGLNSIPIFDIIEIKNIQYFVKRKSISRFIVYHFEKNNYYVNVLENLKKKSTIDDLTSCYNKKETELIFKRMLSSYLRYQEICFTVVMFDLDHFKKVNDTHGHLAGDYVLTEIAKLIKSHLRDSDIFGRVGGEEFTILLTQTKISGALKIANKLLKTIEEHEFIYNGTVVPVTISIGITSILKNDSYHSIVDRVDNALYQAKSNGRNRIEYL